MAHFIIKITYTIDQIFEKLLGKIDKTSEVTSNIGTFRGSNPLFTIQMNFVDYDQNIKPYLDEKRSGECVSVELFRVSKSGETGDFLIKRISDLGLDLDPRILKVLATKPEMTLGELLSRPIRYHNSTFKGLGRKSFVQIQDKLWEQFKITWDVDY